MKLAAVGIKRSGEIEFTTRSEKTLLTGEYSAEEFKKMYPERYRDLVRCGMLSLTNGKITVMS